MHDRLSPHVRPVHYDCQWSLVQGVGRVPGHVRVSVISSEPVSEIRLHSHASMVIEQVTVDGHVAPWSRPCENADVIDIAAPLLPDQVHHIFITFVAQVRNDALGIYISADGYDCSSICTQFQPSHARKAFPCFDEPEFKATFAVTILWTGDRQWHVLSNAPVRKKYSATTASGSTKVVFQNTEVMSTYTLAFVVGQLQKPTRASITTTGCHVRVWRLATDSNTSRAHKVQKFACAVLDLLSRALDAPFLLSKLDLVPVCEFHAQAMENWGLVTFHAPVLEVEDEDDPDHAMKWETVAHEMAHMWFGNLATLKWWDDLWMHEGVSTFLAAWVMSKLGFGPGQHAKHLAWPRFLDYNMSECTRSDALAASRAIVQPAVPASTSVLMNQFDSVGYGKAALVIRSLFLLMGERPFMRALHTLVTTCAYRSMDRFIFVEVFQEQAGDGVRVADFLRPWLTQPGYPELFMVSGRATRRGRRVYGQRRSGYDLATFAEPWPVLLKTDAETYVIVWDREFEASTGAHNFLLDGCPCLAVLSSADVLNPTDGDLCSHVAQVTSVNMSVRWGRLPITSVMLDTMNERSGHSLPTWDIVLQSWSKCLPDSKVVREMFQRGGRMRTRRKCTAAISSGVKSLRKRIMDKAGCPADMVDMFARVGKYGSAPEWDWALTVVLPSEMPALFSKSALSDSHRDEWMMARHGFMDFMFGHHTTCKAFQEAIRVAHATGHQVALWMDFLAGPGRKLLADHCVKILVCALVERVRWHGVLRGNIKRLVGSLDFAAAFPCP